MSISLLQHDLHVENIMSIQDHEHVSSASSLPEHAAQRKQLMLYPAPHSNNCGAYIFPNYVARSMLQMQPSQSNTTHTNNMTRVQLLENRHTTMLQWHEPWPACGSQGNDLDAHATLEATVHDCINMARL